ITAAGWNAPKFPRGLMMAVLVLTFGATVFAPAIMSCVLSLARRIHFAPRVALHAVEQTAWLIQHMKGRAWLIMLALSLIMHILTALVFVLAAKEFDVHADWGRLGFYYVAMNLVIMLPVTFAGLGAREQVSIWLLGKSASAASMPVALSWYLLMLSVVHA